MKYLSPALAAHYASDITTITTCWKVTRRDGQILGFTAHDAPLTIDHIVYEAISGFSPTAISASAALNVDNLDIEGMLSSASITEADILAGKYDFAEISVFEVNWQDVSQGVMLLRTGWLGEIEMRGGHFVAEMRGLTQKLSQTVGRVYSPHCRADLGDSACQVDMSQRIVYGSITQVISSSIIQDSSRHETGALFTHGVFTMTSGNNTGLSREVKRYHQGQISLSLPLPYEVAIGDTYSLTQGCDKQFSTCRMRFDNAVNFRGEPHVPGFDKMLETATTRNL